MCAEGEYVLYSIVILRGQYEAGKFEGDTFVPGNNVDYVEPLKHAFRDKRYIVREFNYDAAKSGGLDGQISAAAGEVQQVHQTIVRWCQAHYGEAYAGWIHLKVRALLRDCAAFFPLSSVPHPRRSLSRRWSVASSSRCCGTVCPSTSYPCSSSPT